MFFQRILERFTKKEPAPPPAVVHHRELRVVGVVRDSRWKPGRVKKMLTKVFCRGCGIRLKADTSGNVKGCMFCVPPRSQTPIHV